MTNETAEILLKIDEKAPPSGQSDTKTEPPTNKHPKPRGRNARRHPIHESFWVAFRELMKREGLDSDSFYKAGIDGHTLSKLKNWFEGNGGPLVQMAPQTCKKLVAMIDKPNVFRTEIRTIEDMRMLVKSGN